MVEVVIGLLLFGLILAISAGVAVWAGRKYGDKGRK